MNQPSMNTDAPKPSWPVYAVWSLTLGWVVCLVASVVLPDMLAGPGHSGWDTLGYFLMVQFIAAGIAVFALLSSVVLWLTGRIGPWTWAVGLMPAFLTAAVLIYLTVFTE